MVVSSSSSSLAKDLACYDDYVFTTQAHGAETTCFVVRPHDYHDQDWKNAVYDAVVQMPVGEQLRILDFFQLRPAALGLVSNNPLPRHAIVILNEKDDLPEAIKSFYDHKYGAV